LKLHGCQKADFTGTGDPLAFEQQVRLTAVTGNHVVFCCAR
jgi:hypothetical protein